MSRRIFLGLVIGVAALASSPVSPLVEGEAHGQQGGGRLNYSVRFSTEPVRFAPGPDYRVESRDGIPRAQYVDNLIRKHLQGYKPLTGYAREGDEAFAVLFCDNAPSSSYLDVSQNGRIIHTRINLIDNTSATYFLSIPLRAWQSGLNSVDLIVSQPSSGYRETFAQARIHATPRGGVITGQGGVITSQSGGVSIPQREPRRNTIYGGLIHVPSNYRPPYNMTLPNSGSQTQQLGLPIRSSQSQAQSVPQSQGGSRSQGGSSGRRLLGTPEFEDFLRRIRNK